MKKIIDRIILIRKEKGLTQKDLADKLGISIVSYSKIERGETQLSIEKVYSISKALSIDPATLLYPNFDQVKYNEELKKRCATSERNNFILANYIRNLENTISLIYKFNPDVERWLDAYNSKVQHPDYIRKILDSYEGL